MKRTAREFFEAVRAAAQDADRCKQQLDSLESRMYLIGGGGFEPHSTSNVDPDKLGRRVAAYVDMDAKLSKRIKDDYELIDRACIVLYGEDQMGDGGLCKVKSGVWADVLWWRYCAAETWGAVSRAVGYSVRPCQEFNGKALAWIDRNRYASRLIDDVDL